MDRPLALLKNSQRVFFVVYMDYLIMAKKIFKDVSYLVWIEQYFVLSRTVKIERNIVFSELDSGQ